MSRKLFLGALALAAVGVIGGTLATNAYMTGNGAGMRNWNGTGRNYDPARHEQMTAAINNNDYNAWKSLMGDRPMTKYINSDNFNKFAEMKKLMLAGKTEEARKIAADLGLPMGMGGGKGNCNCPMMNGATN